MTSIACSPYEEEPPSQITEPRRPPILETLAICDSITGAYLELQIANEALLHLTTQDVTIKAHKLDITLRSMIDHPPIDPADDINEGTWEQADFYIDDMRLPMDYDALQIKIELPSSEVGERGCKDPMTFQATGKCRLAEPGYWGRTIGFYGSPRNCNHTDWEWKRKRWWGYKKLYDRDSYSSSSTIGYSSSAHYDAFQLRIDPNNSCCFIPGGIDFNFVYAYSTSSDCKD